MVVATSVCGKGSDSAFATDLGTVDPKVSSVGHVTDSWMASEMVASSDVVTDAEKAYRTVYGTAYEAMAMTGHGIASNLLVDVTAMDLLSKAYWTNAVRDPAKANDSDDESAHC